MNNADTQAAAILTDRTDDIELASRAANGDVRAFEFIMRRHNRLLFRTARSILKNDADTEDALQEAYLGAWRSIKNFRADAKLSTWLVRIVVNQCLGRLRRSDAQVIPFDAATEANMDQGDAQAATESSEQPDHMAMHAQVRQLIEARIDALPDVFRTVFVLRAVEELTVEEVSAALAIPEATVRSRFFRARGLLREGLARDVDVAIDGAFSFDGARCDRIVTTVLLRFAQAAAAQDSS